MSYLHIENLYKAKEILEFKRCYAMEKVHGTSAHIKWKEGKLHFFAGGADHISFVALFDQMFLEQRFTELNREEVTIYGEAYGGKLQGMSATYGKNLKFIAFEVQFGNSWINVPVAEKIVESFNIEFVPYNLISTDLEVLDQERDRDSVVAIRNGMGEGHKREGIVLRPLIELHKNNGERIIAKYKREDFIETKTPRKVTEEKLKVLENAQDIADEWVTEMRLSHVLDKMEKPVGIEKTSHVIRAMFEDILREGKGEIADSPEARKEISRRTALMFKERLKEELWTK